MITEKTGNTCSLHTGGRRKAPTGDTGARAISAPEQRVLTLRATVASTDEVQWIM